MWRGFINSEVKELKVRNIMTASACVHMVCCGRSCEEFVIYMSFALDDFAYNDSKYLAIGDSLYNR